jgi:hypothetical protein
MIKLLKIISIFIISFLIICSIINPKNVEVKKNNLESDQRALKQLEVSSNQQTRFNPNSQNDLILNNNELKVISNIFNLNGNLSLSNNATLKIKNANVLIQGWVELMNNSRLIINNSTFSISPTQVLNDTTIVDLSGNCQVSILNSDLTINNQPDETIVPYILSSDDSNVSIVNSTLTTNYPKVPLEIRWGTAGLLLLNERATWTLENAKVHARMNPDGAYRWCILQADARFTANNVSNSISDPSRNAFIKPNSGTIEAKDSQFLGRMPVAVLGRGFFVNSIFKNELEILDNAIVHISDSTIENIQIGYWSGSAIEAKLPSPQLFMNNSKVNNLYVSGNTSARVVNSTVKGVARVDKDAKLSFINSSLYNPIIQFVILDNATLIVNNPVILRRITMISGSCNLVLMNASVTRLTIYQQSLSLKLIDSLIDELRTYGNMILNCELSNSLINKFINTPSEGKRGVYNLTLIDSTIPPAVQQQNITTYINYRLDINILLNTKPIKTPITINFHNQTSLIKTEQSNQKGFLSVDLPYKIISYVKNDTNDFILLESSYLGFTSNKKINLNQSMKIHLSWTDTKAPLIYDIEYNPSRWNSQKWIIVRAKVKDIDVKVISNVTLIYSTNDGRSWKEKTMVNIMNDSYEAIIPRHNRGTKISFYIIAYDMAGNSGESPRKSFEVGFEFSLIIKGLLVLGLGIIIFLGFIRVKNNRKVKKYSWKRRVKANSRKNSLKNLLNMGDGLK